LLYATGRKTTKKIEIIIYMKNALSSWDFLGGYSCPDGAQVHHKLLFAAHGGATIVRRGRKENLSGGPSGRRRRGTRPRGTRWGHPPVTDQDEGGKRSNQKDAVGNVSHLGAASYRPNLVGGGALQQRLHFLMNRRPVAGAGGCWRGAPQGSAAGRRSRGRSAAPRGGMGASTRGR